MGMISIAAIVFFILHLTALFILPVWVFVVICVYLPIAWVIRIIIEFAKAQS